MNCELIIKGKYIATMDENSTIIENGMIVVQNKTIIAISSQKEISRYNAGQIIDAGNSIVMPGMINTHTHAAMSYFRGLADDMELDEWLTGHIWPKEAKCVNADFVENASELGCLEMIKAGITCFNDMYFFEEETAEVARAFGIRAVVGEGIIDFPTPSCKNPEQAIDITINLIKKYKEDELIKAAFAPHSIYTCKKENLEKIKQLAGQYCAIIHIHLSETKKEFDETLGKYQLTPTQYLDSFNFLNERVVASHCVWLDENDLKILSEANVKIAHNPISNLKLISGIAPILEASEKHKITVGLGTDGPASNNTLDLFTEMRIAALMHKIKNNDPVALAAKQIVKMATISGAKCLSMDKDIGSIEIGKKADIITINLNQPHLQPIYDIYSHLVYCANAGDVHNVVINGRVIMKDRKMADIDEEKIIENAKIFKENLK